MWMDSKQHLESWLTGPSDSVSSFKHQLFICGKGDGCRRNGAEVWGNAAVPRWLYSLLRNTRHSHCSPRNGLVASQSFEDWETPEKDYQTCVHSRKDWCWWERLSSWGKKKEVTDKHLSSPNTSDLTSDKFLTFGFKNLEKNSDCSLKRTPRE